MINLKNWYTILATFYLLDWNISLIILFIYDYIIINLIDYMNILISINIDYSIIIIKNY